MIDFPRTESEAAGLEKEPWQRCPLWMVLTKVIQKVPRPRSIWSAARHEAVPAWAANRLLRKRAIENCSICRKLVYVGRRAICKAVRAKLRAQVVGDHVQDAVHESRRRRREV